MLERVINNIVLNQISMCANVSKLVVNDVDWEFECLEMVAS